MWNKSFLLLGCFLFAGPVVAQWSCTQDAQCSDVAGSVCAAGACVCPTGQQLVSERCTNLAPYHTSVCVENHQCSRMFAFFECRRAGGAPEGECGCQNGFHYFLGRCWRSVGYGAACTRDEECIDVPRDPYSLRCDGTCGCADGYYERQRGECRKIAYSVGDGCVLDEDCQFPNGVCDLRSMTCELGTVSRTSSKYEKPIQKPTRANVTSSVVTSVRTTRQHGTACTPSTGCDAPFECAAGAGACVCPVGYYASTNGTVCLAELGSVSTHAQCAGLLAVLEDDVCACPPNFYYDENMRDCVKVTRRITDSCTSDANCHTFGSAGVCGPPEEPWQMRRCACDAERSVWDASRQMCRLFAGVGEACEEDSDCLAGELEIVCAADETGQGYCACPDGLVAVDGLCLTTGLSIGEACQSSQECTETPNSACLGGYCACADGYQQMGEDYCAPIIGGTCAADGDCVIEHTVCHNDTNVLTCQCDNTHVAHDDTCWPVSLGFEADCNHTAQCSAAMGDRSECADGRCVCADAYHFRDGNCWPVTGLFDSCSRTSQCYLSSISERVVCRNSMCQCDFEYPYSEELHTCVSAAAGVFGSTLVIIISIVNLML